MFQSFLQKRLQLFKNKCAIKTEDKEWSYNDLSLKANSVAQMLINNGLKKEAVVALFFEDKVSYVYSTIAVLAARGCFLPIETSLPEERIKFMLNEVGCDVILCDDINYKKLVKNLIPDRKDIKILNIENSQVIGVSEFIGFPLEYNQEDRIYIYFTSGSSGLPKAIVGKNKSLWNYIKWQIECFNLKEDLQFSQLVTVGFDAFLRDIFTPLCSGGTINIRKEQGCLTSKELISWINIKKINIIHCVPSVFRLLLQQKLDKYFFQDLKYVFLSGEPIHPAELKDWFSVYGEEKGLINLYGPTETTMTKTFYQIKGIDVNRVKIPIGKPMAGSRILILDEKMRLCDTLIEGEVFIRTPFMTHGYFREELNEGKFVPNPLIPGSKEIVYKTGDLAKYLPDGNIELGGRVDRQIKIRGVRVEPAEIENAVMENAGIKSAILTKEILEENRQEVLVCFIESDAKESLSNDNLVESLKTKLPEAILPSVFISLETFPKLSNGKVDYRKLKELFLARDNGLKLPENEYEEKLLQVWQEVFKTRNISIDNTVFEVGGHSLTLFSLINRIQETFGVKLTIKELYSNTTIRKQALLVVNYEKYEYQSIPKRERKEYYPLSSIQKRLYFLHKLNEKDLSYNIPLAFTVKGDLNLERFENSFKQLVEKHESLRLSFDFLNDHPIQKVNASVPFSIQYFNSNSLGLEKFIQSFIKPFELNLAPLLRVGLFEVKKGDYVLVVDLHHIIADGISIQLLVKEFFLIYIGNSSNSFAVDYLDYTRWIDSVENRKNIGKQKDYWLGELAGELPLLNLPTDKIRPAIKSSAGSSVYFELGEELTTKLRFLAQSENLSMFTVLFSLVKILLFKVTNQNDIIVGLPVSGRQHVDIEKIIGLFINTLAIRSTVQEEATVRELFKEVRNKVVKGLENQEYQYERLVEDLNIPRDLSRNPIFDVIFNYQALTTDVKEQTGLQIEPFNFGERAAKFDLTIIAKETNSDIYLELNYAKSIFNKETIVKIKDYLLHIATFVAKTLDEKISNIEIVLGIERDKVLHEFNSTQVEYPKEKLIQDFFLEQVKQKSDETALVFENESMTYGELDHQSDILASYLQSQGVGPDKIVGIITDRSPKMIVGILAILKAGGAYLPIDPIIPQNRLFYIIEDSKMEILLISSKYYGKSEGRCKEVNITKKWSEIDYQKPDNLHFSSKNLAYVIYTSGSTGNPKGVQIEHHSLVNRLLWMQKNYSIDQKDVLIQKTPYSFDVSVWEIFWWFIGGSKLFLLPSGDEREPELLFQKIISNKVTTIHFVPSMLQVFLNYLTVDHVKQMTFLRQVFCSGEALPKSLVLLFKEKIYDQNKTNLINLYGPTEATVDVSYFNCFECEESSIVPIGRPIDNTELYVLDKSNRVVPIGVSGELHISGVGLSRGYLNRDELNQSRFINHPYKTDEKLYKTGDLARWLPDGNIEYLGRIDNQVKIRGFRIELGEIENRLSEFDGVKECVVVARKSNHGVNDLIAYYVSEAAIEPEAVRKYLLSFLPEYMVPVYFVWLESFPITRNGKLDRQSLPVPETVEITGYVEPANETQKVLSEIWSEVLGRKKVGASDNFFLIGGDSLKAVAITSRILKRFNQNFKLTTFLSNPTIEKISKHIENQEEKCESDLLSKACKKDYYPISLNQERLYVLQSLFPNSVAYNVPIVFKVLGKFKSKKIEDTFYHLMERHEIFRMHFKVIDDTPYQVFPQTIEPSINYYESEEADYKKIIKNFIFPFDVNSQSPLWRVSVVKVNSEEHIVVVDFHHLIIDGISKNIFFKDFVKIYNGEVLPEQEYQYKDFSEWQYEFLKSDSLKKQRDYWLAKFKKPVPVLRLPVDFERPNLQEFTGNMITVTLASSVKKQLDCYIKERQLSLHTFVLAVINVLLSKYTALEDIVVGSDIAGRRSMELENVVGFFTGQIPLRNYPTKNKKFIQFLEEVKTASIEAIENQDYQFNKLIQELGLAGRYDRNPLFDVFLSVGNMQMTANTIDNILDNECTFIPIPNNNVQAVRDLQFNFTELKDEVKIDIIYNILLFKQDTCIKLINRLVEIINQVLDTENILIRDIQLSTDLMPTVSKREQEIASDFIL